MNDREKQILKILRRNPLIQQNEIADILQISRSRVAAHIMDLMRKGMIKGKGYILTEQDYCVVVGAINMDIRGVADIHYPQAASHPGSIHCSAGGVGRNIAHNTALLGRDVHLISAVGSDFMAKRCWSKHVRQASTFPAVFVCTGITPQPICRSPRSRKRRYWPLTIPTSCNS